MLTDAHCHPLEVSRRASLPVEALYAETAYAGNAFTPEEFLGIEAEKKKAASRRGPLVLACFSVHPQFPSFIREREGVREPAAIRCRVEALLSHLESLAAKRRLDAIGETGFDLFNESFRSTEAGQEDIFRHHLETALRYGLPMTLHIRKATRKIFPFVPELRRLPAAIFHSWQGSPVEAESLLRRGVNAFFSFGAAIRNNHKQAIRCAAVLPGDRLLTETDAPYIPLRGNAFSSPEDLPGVLAAAASLRSVSPRALEEQVAANFFRAFQAR